MEGDDVRMLTFLFTIMIIHPVYAVFGEENLALLEIASTTASQLNELEQLVTTSEKYTEQMMRLNDYANESINFAQRTEVWMEDMSYLTSKKDVQTLGEINSYIRDIKYSREELRGLITELQIEKRKSKKEQVISGRISNDSEKRLVKYKNDTKVTNLKDQPKVLGKIASNTHNIMAESAVTNATLGKQLEAINRLDERISDIESDHLKKELEEEKNSKSFFSSGLKKKAIK